MKKFLKNIKRRKTLVIFLLLAIFSLAMIPVSEHSFQAAQKKSKKTKYFTLNFNDIEIKEFINVMSQLTGKNIILDDRVRGKITISSAKKIPVNQAYSVMKSILEVKRLAVIETDNLVKIVPFKNAIKKNSEIIVNADGSVDALKGDKTITYLMEMKKAEATDIYNVLRSLKSDLTNVVLYRPLNTIVISGSANDVHGLVKIATALDKEFAEEIETPTGEDATAKNGLIHVVHLQNANAEQLSEVLSRIPFSETAKINNTPLQRQVNSSRTARRTTSSQNVNTSQSKSKLSIIANKQTNSLIITATPTEFKEIQRIIKVLDTVREQVLIEALIVEVNAENGWGFGVDWMLGYQQGNNTYGTSNLGKNAASYKDWLSGDSKTPMPLNQGFQVGYLYNNNIIGFIMLNASGKDNLYNILSTPQIVTIDNEEAELNVGEEIAVPSDNRITDSGTVYNTYEYKSVGMKLKITPHITNSNKITIDLYQEVNSVLSETTISSSAQLVPPTLGKRDLKTKVTVEDGKTIVVGGLIRNDKKNEETKVPILGDIPVLGWLFKTKSVSYTKKNLLVFITPHIVTNPDKLDAVTKQKREQLKRLNIKK